MHRSIPLAALVTCALSGPVAHAALPVDDALSLKPVLSNLLGNETRLGDAIAALDLDEGRADAFRALVDDEKLTVLGLTREARAAVGADGVADPQAVAAYNEAVADFAAAQAERLETLLGEDGYDAFLAYAEPRWQADAERWGEMKIEAGQLTYNVFCTQYNAYTTYEVAVPDKYVKFAAQGTQYHSGYPADGDYRVTLNRGGAPYTVRVYEVGPWNIDDNYWNAANDPERPRRLFTDLPKGMPEAQAAYQNGYNGGKDQYGRTVLNPGGCDLSIQVAADIGLNYLQNDWIDVTYLWESGGGSTGGGCLAPVPGGLPLGRADAFGALFLIGGMALFGRRRRGSN